MKDKTSWSLMDILQNDWAECVVGVAFISVIGVLAYITTQPKNVEVSSSDHSHQKLSHENAYVTSFKNNIFIPFKVGQTIYEVPDIKQFIRLENSAANRTDILKQLPHESLIKYEKQWKNYMRIQIDKSLLLEQKKESSQKLKTIK